MTSLTQSDGLDCHDLACRRGGRDVFVGLSFHLAAGEIGEVRGPNGVGKSSLLRLLAGLLPMADGTARFGDIDLGDDLAGFQDCLAYLGHLDAVKPALSPAENLGLWASLHGTGRDDVETALDRFGLGKIADRPAAECSAGQRRRVGLARLMLCDRPLWLLDEPTTSLDVASSALVAEMLREHRARGGIALVATHVDLGLREVRVIEMRPSPVATRPKPEADPFLDGAW